MNTEGKQVKIIHKLSQFADDTSLSLYGSEQSLKVILYSYLILKKINERLIDS